MLTDLYLQLVNKYSNDNELATNLWLEIFTRYSEPRRHYHTIDHLVVVINELKEVKDNIADWDTTLFAAFYHDVIYKPSSNCNEADSVKLAMARLSNIGFPVEKIEKCATMILATKQHGPSEDRDTCYLCDADLRILGSDPYDYQKYTMKVREENSIYPDFVYNSGRKKVLQHYLQMDPIFKTESFCHKYESNARENISNELASI